MAVFTNLQTSDIKNILNDYNLGKLVKFNGIKEGIENPLVIMRALTNKRISDFVFIVNLQFVFQF